ncbi:rhomboid family intramembrane serine protease, partial [Bacteroidales bacterium]|nr:rhomboid family intramembrane serine protease [Bacteroidales bacterium]
MLYFQFIVVNIVCLKLANMMDSGNWFDDSRKLLKLLWFPIMFSVIVILIRFYEVFFDLDFRHLGVEPRTGSGMVGILFSPLLHSSGKHLYNNIIPLFLLTSALFYFYKTFAYRILFFIYLFSGIVTWLIGRHSYHIGASGVVYGLSAFLFLSGIFRKLPKLIAISLLVVFLYGSMVWGVLPYELLPVDENMSWEGHLGGALSGIVLAIRYRKLGPQRKKIVEIFPDEEEEILDEDEYWKKSQEEEPRDEPEDKGDAL